MLFLAARTAFRDLLQPRVGPWLSRLQRGFAENELNYLLFLRLVPLFPFFVVNLVPAFLGVRLRSFVIATFFGIIPGSFVFAQRRRRPRQPVRRRPRLHRSTRC